MARLKRRGMGKFNMQRLMLREEYIQQSFEGLDSAYAQLWADAEKCTGDYKNSYFWALMFQVTTFVMRPLTQEVSKRMNREVLSSVMCWNSGMCRASELAHLAFSGFEKWFTEEFLPEHDARCEDADERLLLELNDYVGEAMERDGVHPVHLHYFSTARFYKQLRRLMMDELLPTVEVRIAQLIPAEIRDSRFAFIRRRRLRKGVNSFFELKEAEGAERGAFIGDILIGEKLMLDHANAVMHALGRSIMAEKLRLCGK